MERSGAPFAALKDACLFARDRGLCGLDPRRRPWAAVLEARAPRRGFAMVDARTRAALQEALDACAGADVHVLRVRVAGRVRVFPDPVPLDGGGFEVPEADMPPPSPPWTASSGAHVVQAPDMEHLLEELAACDAGTRFTHLCAGGRDVRFDAQGGSASLEEVLECMEASVAGGAVPKAAGDDVRERAVFLRGATHMDGVLEALLPAE